MTTRLPSLLLATASLCIAGQALAAGPADCKPDAATGSVCLARTADLRPTQFAVGSVAVECKKQDIEGKYASGKLDKYLAGEERQVPAVVGPDGQLYITDHHHLSTAVYRAKSGDWQGREQKLHVKVLENFQNTDISMASFWKIMAMQHNVWPLDEKGKEVKGYGDALPRMDMGDLKDNPYRTLSRWTRESCGYVKAGKPQCLPLEAIAGAPTAPYFMEFYWAEFLRDQLGKDNSELDSPKKLMASYPDAIKATLSKKKSSEYFGKQGLDAVNYGQNQEGRYFALDFSKDGCESWYLQKD